MVRCSVCRCICLVLFFFNDTATTEIYTLSLHDALPIFRGASQLRTWIYRIVVNQARNRQIQVRSEEHTSELQSQSNLVCRLLLEKKKKKKTMFYQLHKKDIELESPELSVRQVVLNHPTL